MLPNVPGHLSLPRPPHFSLKRPARPAARRSSGAQQRANKAGRCLSSSVPALLVQGVLWVAHQSVTALTLHACSPGHWQPRGTPRVLGAGGLLSPAQEGACGREAPHSSGHAPCAHLTHCPRHGHCPLCPGHLRAPADPVDLTAAQWALLLASRPPKGSQHQGQLPVPVLWPPAEEEPDAKGTGRAGTRSTSHQGWVSPRGAEAPSE